MAAVAAGELGYVSLKVYAGGLPDWAARGLPLERGLPAPAQR